MTSPRILLLTENFPPAVGGSAALFGHAYGRLEMPGLQVVAAREPGAAASEPFGSGRVDRTLERMPTWGALTPAGVRGYLRLARAVRRTGARTDTFVHCGRVLLEGFGAWLAERRTGAPFVCWTHGEEIGYIRGSRELRGLARLVHRQARALIANCRNTVRILEAFGVPPRRTHVIYPGVEARRFVQASGSAVRSRFVRGDEKLLLTVGRLEARKGHDLTIRALANLVAKGYRVRYVIAGDGRERARLEQVAADAGVRERVHFAGSVPDDQLPEYYAACDLFVLPNRAIGDDVEGFGIVFLEAAAAGKATIGGRTGGVPEAIAEGQSGLLVSGENPDELASTIETLLASDARRLEMGTAGRRRVEQEFSWDRTARELLALHEALVERRPQC